MSFGPEVQLLLAAALFFIYDSSQLLYSNEAILSPAGKGWSVQTCDNNLILRGRKLFITNPLTLHRPFYRLRWDDEKLELGQCHTPEQRISLNSWFSFLAYCSLASIFAVLPALLYFHRTDVALLSCTVAIYLISLLAGVTILMKHQSLGLTAKQARSLAAELIFCPPFTANVVRRLGLAQTLGCNLIAASLQLLTPTQWGRLKLDLIEQIDLEISDAEELSPRESNLMTTKNLLLKTSS